MAIRRRGWIALAVVATAVVVLLLGLTGRGDVPDVTVTRVVRQKSIATWISPNGKVEPITPYVLASRLNTFVLHVAVVSGQQVKKGQLLVQLDATAARAQLAAARQNLLKARRELQYAEAGGSPDELAQLQNELTKTQAQRDRLAAEQKTLKNLVEQHAATRDELERNEVQLKQAEADLLYWQQKKRDLARQSRFNASQAQLLIEQTQAQISDLGEKVASSRVVAPVDGTVYALPAKLGDYVHVGDPVASVADLRRVRILAYVDEVDLGRVAPGQPVEVQWDGLPGHVWKGRVEQVPKQVVPYHDRRVGEVVCSVDTSDGRLIPNTNVDLQIRVAEQTGSLVVPRSAVQGDSSGRYVFLVQGDRLRQKPVTVGIANMAQFQILAGLKEGDLVALPGAEEFKDGMQVHPVGVQ